MELEENNSYPISSKLVFIENAIKWVCNAAMYRGSRVSRSSPFSLSFLIQVTSFGASAEEAFNILTKIGAYGFCIIGRPETDSYYQKVLREIKRFNLQSKIEFYKRPTDEEKFEILSKSYLFINPSIREGWGLVNIEANVVGTPVIAYPSQGLVDSVCDNLSGVLTKNSTPENIAEEIEKLVRDKVKYQRLSIGAKKWASKFSWEKSRKLSLDLIHKIYEN